MFVELLEQLRCPRQHEESALIASATRTDSRHIVEGTLGCAVCGAEFPIRSGVAYFDDVPPPAPPSEEASAEKAMRLSAFLELTDARGFALLCGRWSAHTDQINRLSEIPLVLVNPADNVSGDVAAIIRSHDGTPFREGSARGVALDATSSRALVQSLVRAVQPGGRVIGPAAMQLPDGITEVVRDDQLWVAEKTPAGVPGLVSLRRERRH